MRKISRFISYLGAIFFILPLAFLLRHLLDYSPSMALIVEHVLFEVISNTFTLTLFVVITTSALGIFFAILTTLYDFPFKKLLRVLLVLPMAIPPYISAFTYAHMLSWNGPIQIFLRQYDINIAHFSIMNIRGAIFIFTITLYPYVYLLCVAYLKRHSRAIFESARMLGGKRKFSIIVPLIFPSVLSAATLVGLEVINDIGVSHYFGIRTLSTLIFQAWNQMFDLALAVRLSLTTIVFIALYIFLTRLFRNDKKYIENARSKPVKPIKLTSTKALLGIFSIILIVSISFIIPFSYMVSMAAAFISPTNGGSSLNITHLTNLSMNTIGIAFLTTFIILALSLIIASYTRFSGKKEKSILKITNIGYATPSTILAIGIISFFSTIGNFGFTLIMLVSAYVIKYFSLGYLLVERGFEKVGKTYTESSKMLGRNDFLTFLKVDIFTIKNSIISGGILIFIDIVKELPLTLILRSFNFETLSTRVYMFAANEQILASAPFS
ncbi:MAG: iron ABC transporter permease, partial [Defluviitaleaceae bacterium]|nr:iron ABC transporter permease [Defluviitaleaceae bacterium]